MLALIVWKVSNFFPTYFRDSWQWKFRFFATFDQKCEFWKKIIFRHSFLFQISEFSSQNCWNQKIFNFTLWNQNYDFWRENSNIFIDLRIFSVKNSESEKSLDKNSELPEIIFFIFLFFFVFFRYFQNDIYTNHQPATGAIILA